MNHRTPAYLDYNATTPVKPAVLDVMVPLLGTVGNASSVHGFGRQARQAIETAREHIARLAGTVPSQVTFTSGATEANNAVLQAFAGQPVLVGATEHPSVLETAPHAQRLPVDENGLIEMTALEAALQGDVKPALLSIMLVNNETGVIQNVAALARRARALHPGIYIHTDAVQAAGRIPLDFPALQVDYMSLSAHKCGGPQGAGALIVAPGAKPAILLHGGGQEKRQRAGTENVAAIAGFGKAAELALAEIAAYGRLEQWRDEIERTIQAIEPRVRLYGSGAPRVANTTNIALPGIAAETQLMTLDLAGIAVSSGSACSSGTVKASHVLQAMGADAQTAGACLRVSLGWGTKWEDCAAFIDAWRAMHDRVRERVVASADRD